MELPHGMTRWWSCACHQPRSSCGELEKGKLLHWAEFEPYVIEHGRAVPISNLLPRSEPKYSWMLEAPWLFQLSALCFSCAKLGRRIRRCCEGGEWHEFHEGICRDCGERV